MELLTNIAEIAEALLAILGGLKILARYTKTQADDKIMSAIEKPLALAANAAKKLSPRKKEDKDS